MKPVSRFAKPAALDKIMSRGWRALEEEALDGWLARYSGGVTKRANSVLPLLSPADTFLAIEAIEERYARRGLPAIFQISPDAKPVDLDRLLAERGYAKDSPTVVQYLALGEPGPGASSETDARIHFADEPSRQWLETWWSVEGPHESAGQTLSRSILARTPSSYVSLVVAGRIEAVARLARVGPLGGIYAVATREESRSRGHGRAIVQAVLIEAAARGLDGVWLQVVESNAVARKLYESLGFETISRYHYRVEPLSGS